MFFFLWQFYHYASATFPYYNGFSLHLHSIEEMNLSKRFVSGWRQTTYSCCRQSIKNKSILFRPEKLQRIERRGFNNFSSPNCSFEFIFFFERIHTL